MTAQFTIEKNVPMPSRSRGSKKYPLDLMDVGDSFFAPDRSASDFSGVFTRYRPNKFSCRKEVVDGVAGVRVWRVK